MRNHHLILALTLALAGSPVLAAPPPSGFIEDLPPLKADASRPSASLYVAPGRSLKGFDKVALEPVEVFYAPDSKYRGVEPNELAEVANGLRDILVDRLEPAYPVVNSEASGVLQLRVAITNVHAEKKKRGVLGYTPAGLVVGAVKDAATAGPNINLRSAWIEAELLDSEGRRLAVLREPMFAGDDKGDTINWKDIGLVLDAWAKRLRARLDADNAR